MNPARTRHLAAYLDDCRRLVESEIKRVIPSGEGAQPLLYQLMLDYPLREAKGLRPALCMATCRAAGGRLDAVLRSAAVLELYHNAFLVHDDVEDESWLRRGRPTLHREHGIPVAVHVGDAMLALTLGPLLENMSAIGLGPALRVLDAIARMTRETVHGQAMELDWVRQGVWALSDADYVQMVVLKTAWYSFIAPVEVGAITARVGASEMGPLQSFARALGVAFQIQDDVLNLRGSEQSYGKEIDGDLWEGKRTLMLLHAFREMTEGERAEARRILALPRPPPVEAGAVDVVTQLRADIDRLAAAGALCGEGLEALRATLDAAKTPTKTEADVRWLRGRVDAYGGIDHAVAVARVWATRAGEELAACEKVLPPSSHRDILSALVDYVVDRVR